MLMMKLYLIILNKFKTLILSKKSCQNISNNQKLFFRAEKNLKKWYLNLSMGVGKFNWK